MWFTFGVYIPCLLTFGKCFVPFHARTTTDKNFLLLSGAVCYINPVRGEKGLANEYSRQYVLNPETWKLGSSETRKPIMWLTSDFYSTGNQTGWPNE